MRKLLGFLAIITLAVVLIFIGSSGVRAATNQPKTVTLAENDTYDGLYIRAGNTIKIMGNVKGDAWLAAQDVVIEGEVSGNVYAAAQNISIRGKIGGNLHLAGARIEIDDEVGGSLIAVSSLISVTRNSKIGNGMIAAASNIDIAGPVASDVYLASSNIVVSSQIGGNVRALTEQLTLTRGASIDGNLTYTSSQNATIENDTNIAGSIKRIDPQTMTKPSVASRARDAVFSIISRLLIGLLIIAILPKTAVATTDYITNHPIKSFFGGIGVFFVALVAIIVALLAIFGLPLAVMLGLGFILVVMAATLFVVPFWVGRLVVRTKDNSLHNLALSLLVGVLIVTAITLLPVIGPLFGFTMFFIGIGALSLRNYERLLAVGKTQRD